LNILFLSHHAELGGGEISLLEFIKALDKNKFNPVAYTGCEGPLRERLGKLGIQAGILNLPEYFWSLKRDPSRKNPISSFVKTALIFNKLIAKIKYIITQDKIDIVCTNTIKSTCIGIPAARKAGVKSVWWLRDCLTEEFYGRFFLWFIKRMTRGADLVICTSETVRRDYLNLAGKDKTSKGKLVSNGVDLEEFRPNRRNEALRDRLAKREERIISLIGRLEPWKGQEIFIKAAEIALAKNPNLKFLIVGGPLFGREEYEDKLKSLIEELGLKEKVLLLGHRSDISDLMAVSDIIVHASYLPEPFGRDIIEAMACGKPLISTNIGGPREIITPETGILVEPNRPDILADEIIKLINDPAKMESLCKNGRKRAEDMFDIKKATKRIEEILLQV